METTTERTAYELACMAEVASPDGPDSPGAKWLRYVEQIAMEAIEYGADLGEDVHEYADSAVPVYTYERWQVFVDLAAYEEDDEGLCGPDDDMTQRAGVALYVIAARLIAALGEDVTDDDEDGN